MIAQRKIWYPLSEYTRGALDKALLDSLEVLQVLILGARSQRDLSEELLFVDPHPMDEPSMENWNTCLAGCWCIKNLGTQLHVYGKDAHLYGGRTIIKDVINLNRYQDRYRPLMKEELTLIDFLDEMRYIGLSARLNALLGEYEYTPIPLEMARSYLPETLNVERRLIHFLKVNGLLAMKETYQDEFLYG
jgi:hypothetical protein